MEWLLRDVRYALVTLRRTPGLTFTVLVTLALGVGAKMAVFTVAHAVLLEPLPYPDSTQLVRLWEEHPGGQSPAGNRWLSLRRGSRGATDLSLSRMPAPTVPTIISFDNPASNLRAAPATQRRLLMLRSLTMRDETDEIRRALDGLNAAWRERRFADLATCFDDAVVMRGPGLIELVRGRDAVVKSYADFMTKSEITEYAESGHAVDRWGDTAVARSTGRWRGSRTARPIARQVRSCSCFNGGALSGSRSSASCSIERRRDRAIGRATSMTLQPAPRESASN